MASSAKLHLIKPLGFDISSSAFKRAGLDYLKSFKFDTHENFDDFLNTCKPSHVYLITRFANYTYSDVDFASLKDEDVYLVFGSETHGLPDSIHEMYPNTRLRVPMQENARCLNLSNTVAILVYEVLRQQDFPGLSRVNTLEG